MPSEPPEPPPWCQAVRQWAGRPHPSGEKSLCPSGSDLLLVQAVLLQWHYPIAEQFQAGAAVHRSLEGLQFVYLSFGLPVAPMLQHGVPDGFQILTHRPRKALHRVDPRRARIDQPSIQTLRLSAAKWPLKPHCQTPHRAELRRRRFQRVDVGDLTSGHLAPGFDAKRGCSQRRDHTTGHRIHCSHENRCDLLLLGCVGRRPAAAPGSEETRQMTEGPCVAAIAYFGEQMPDFGNAFGPKPRQQSAEIRRRYALRIDIVRRS